MAKLQFNKMIFRNVNMSGESSIKEICENLLKEDVEDERTGRPINAKVALCIKMFDHALAGDSKYMSMLLNIIGEMPMTDSEKTVVVPMLVNNIPCKKDD